MAAFKDLAIVALDNLDDAQLYPLERDVDDYPPIALSLHNNVLTMVQPYCDRDSDIQDSWMDGWWGGVFQYELKDGTVFFGHAIDASAGRLQNGAKIGKGCSMMGVRPDGSIWAGNHSELSRITF